MTDPTNKIDEKRNTDMQAIGTYCKTMYSVEAFIIDPQDAQGLRVARDFVDCGGHDTYEEAIACAERCRESVKRKINSYYETAGRVSKATGMPGHLGYYRVAITKTSVEPLEIVI